MSYKLKKKNSFYKMYKKYILRTINVMFYVFVIGGIVVASYLLSSPFSWETMFATAFKITISIFCIILFMCLLYFFILWLIKIKRQLYVPLNEEELKSLHISNSDEYNAFLKKYFHNLRPNKVLQEKIMKTSKMYFTDSQNFYFNQHIKMSKISKLSPFILRLMLILLFLVWICSISVNLYISLVIVATPFVGVFVYEIYRSLWFYLN